MNQPSFHGLLVIDKPSGVTSRDIVNRAQRWFPRKTRIGHAGTLDPLATGVLVLCVGVATRLAEYVQRMDKEYRTRIRLGATSDTDDVDGTVTENPQAHSCSRIQVEEAVAAYIGDIQQTPPKFSANKIDGKRAYELARAGKDVELTAKTVQVYGIDILQFEYPTLELQIECGMGTYIRSIARDLGARLGCGGLVETLRRTRIGTFTADAAISPDTDAETARARLHPPGAAVTELPGCRLNEEQINKWRQGQSVPYHADDPSTEPYECALYGDRFELAGIGITDPLTNTIRPHKVLRT